MLLQARFDFIQDQEEEVKLAVYDPDPEYFWLINSSVMEILLPDSPFIIDTILDYCTSRNIKIHLFIHPVLHIVRDERGNIREIDFAGTNSENRWSQIYLEIARMEPEELSRFTADIRTILGELRVIVRDFSLMLQELNELEYQAPEMSEEAAWLKDNFVILGAARLQEEKISSPYLGILREATWKKRLAAETLPESSRKTGEAIFYRESSLISSVNRRKNLFLILLRSGERRTLLLGHFSSRIRGLARTEIPYVARLLQDITAERRVSEDSYLSKEIFKTAQLLPPGILFTRNKALLRAIISDIVNGSFTSETIFNFHPDHDYGMVWIVGIVGSNEGARLPSRAFQEYAQSMETEIRVNIRTLMHGNEVVILACRPGKSSARKFQRELETRYESFFSSWSAQFRDLIINRNVGNQNINEKLRKYFAGINDEFEVQQSPEETFADLDLLEHIPPDLYAARYYRPPGETLDKIKIYRDVSARLNILTPVLTNFGFTILEVQTLTFQKADRSYYIYTFQMPVNDDLTEADRRRIANIIASVLNGESSSAIVNELAVKLGLELKELKLLKTFIAYYFQIDKRHSFATLRETLLRYPAFTLNFLKCFHAIFRPGSDKEREEAHIALEASFDDLKTVQDESICRGFYYLLRAARRTNYFLDRREISIKFQSRDIPGLPEPVPLYEIFVFSHDLEGIHLRGGLIARGGIRWSDRVDDYRTEILGLMKAQMVKNTLIVPAGSKGGFILKNRTFSDREGFLTAGRDAYRRYIGALLDLTDNLSPDGKTEPAPDIVRRDQDDSYLVVAADKGTASFSDLANEISRDRNFWLDDAFASGGKNGYDHKKQGITARGAWESVRRHFHEMGVDVSRDPVAVVGIGDMGGDVFGNGLLLSRSVKLIAAFNHRHIFLDPDPDPEASYRERERLFKKGLDWNEYDPALISRGGGVYERADREIKLSREARAALGIKNSSLSGEEAIRSILRAPVDLLWNGGIGCYVKSSQETHYEAGDPGNDRVRINAQELRVRVIGEGGNLGLTQAARMEAAEMGVALNTDAVDNSAGVDMSDHEVNLKILLSGLSRTGVIQSETERNKIIRRYEKDEILLVLRHNYENNLGLSLDAIRAQKQHPFFRNLFLSLEEEGLIKRKEEALPLDSELEERRKTGPFLPRPALCSLLGNTKLSLSARFSERGDFRDPLYSAYLRRYFPAGLVKKYEKDVLNHPLQREIIITEIVNDVVNHAGIAYFQRMNMRTGASDFQIADAYVRFSEFLNLNSFREALGDPWMQAEVHYDYLLLLEEEVFRINCRLLENETTLRALTTKNQNLFLKILAESKKYARFRPSRELKRFLQTLDASRAATLKEHFTDARALFDCFIIFAHNAAHPKTPWKTGDYFACVEKRNLHALRMSVASFPVRSDWEYKFQSRLEILLDEFTGVLLEKGPSLDQDREERLTALLEDIISRQRQGGLTAPAFHEMLGFARKILA